MMQQPVFQQEQAGNQQQQQMLLCPVRLVYETQILVQPGDQIQPNQTIVINPQNPPPWAQNRVQNQVIYVQNVPNNFMPPVQQHVDQNQMFLQQSYGLPQLLQQQMLAQNHQDQIRNAAALQMGNLPANMQQQMQNNIAQIMPNERMIAHNFGHLQVNPGINIANGVQNQINVPVSISNRQIVQNVPKTTEIPNNPQKPHEVLAQNYRNYAQQQMTQQINVRPQMQQNIAMIPMNNTMQKPAQNYENVGQPTSMQQNIASSSNQQMQQTFVNTMTNVPPRGVPMSVQKPPNNMLNTNIVHPVKQQTFSYRPIQPRPQQYRSNAPLPAMTVQPSPIVQIQPNPNVIDVTRLPGPSAVNNYTRMDNNHVQFNRKRKSESPDELHRKITIVPAPQTSSASTMIVKRIDNPVQQNPPKAKVHTNEIGVNTNPIVKVSQKISTNNNMIQINPIVDQHAKIKEELAKPILNLPPVQMQTNNETQNINNQVQPEKERLVRNTVYTQARFGRLLNDKQVIPVASNIDHLKPPSPRVSNVDVTKNPNNDVPNVSSNNVPNVSNNNVPNISNNSAPKISNNDVPRKSNNDVPKMANTDAPRISNIDVPKTSNIEMKPIAATAPPAKVETEVKVKEESKKIENVDVSKIKTENTKAATEVKEEKLVPEMQVDSEEKKLTESMNHMNNSDNMPEIKLKQDRDFILTHVLDGFVIQESNVAFPIRVPLKEKTFALNSAQDQANLKQDPDVKEPLPNKIPDLSHLHLSESERLKAEEEMKEEAQTEENPFKDLQRAVVKNWTVDELATHLSNFNWKDTISVLQEHEIDGESLFLVSKMQLVTIGISENHADVICDFVK